MPVGTRGAVKYLSAVDYEAARRRDRAGQHLPPDAAARAPTSSRRSAASGPFAGWDGLTLTDSGGFQVFSLGPDVDDDGVTFRSTYDGSRHRLTPESAVAVQEQLGATIQMVLDVCPGAAGAARGDPPGRRAHGGVGQARPGGAPPHRSGAVRHRAGRHRRGAARGESARRTVDLDFDGYGIGGLSVGETRAEMLPALAAALDELPGRPAPLPDGRGRPGVAGRGGRPRRRPVRLRAADPPRPPRHRPHRRRARSTCATPATPAPTSRSTPTAPARSAGATPAATCATCSWSTSRRRRAWSRCTTWPGRSP